MNTATKVREKIPSAGMSQIIFLAQPEQACCVVGSCIALTLFHKRMGIGALVHIVLPKSPVKEAPPGKFADTAIPYLLDELLKRGCNRAELVATMSGGASMFGPTGPIQIGEQNIEAVTRLLGEAGIPIKGDHLRGAKGRRILFDSATGDVTIQIAGQPMITL